MFVNKCILQAIKCKLLIQTILKHRFLVKIELETDAWSVKRSWSATAISQQRPQLVN